MSWSYDFQGGENIYYSLCYIIVYETNEQNLRLLVNFQHRALSKLQLFDVLEHCWPDHQIFFKWLLELSWCNTKELYKREKKWPKKFLMSLANVWAYTSLSRDSNGICKCSTVDIICLRKNVEKLDTFSLKINRILPKCAKRWPYTPFSLRFPTNC